jgi:AAA+ superfamily predicted ATPase
MMAYRAAGNWLSLNRTYLKRCLQRVRLLLQAPEPESDRPEACQTQLETLQNQLQDIRAQMRSLPAIDALCDSFALSGFERDILLLGAGIELEAAFAKVVARVNGNGGRADFALALSVLPDPHWSALTASSPLRRWRLINLQPHGGFVAAPYSVDERVLHYLTGIDELDSRMAPYLQPLTPPSPKVGRQYAAAIEHFSRKLANDHFSHLVHLYGDNISRNRLAVSLAYQVLGMRCFRLLPGFPANDPVELEAFSRLWERESVLSRAGLLVELDESYTPAQLECVLTRFRGPVVFASTRRLPAVGRQMVVLEPPAISRSELMQFFRQHAAPWADSSNGCLQQVVDQFQLSVEQIQNVGTQLTAPTGEPSPEAVRQQLWHACRIHARQNMDAMAQRVEAIATWDDLVLPESAIETLKRIADQVRHKHTVYDGWGFRQQSNRGFGISALFVGDSGTGKTMAAEVIANELQLDLYRIDLSQVVSKYIGETEKNLNQVFHAAERSGAVLLFDEADALFGKRSEVKDSHDRYANIEISFLLQRMEAYNGLAILTTNMRKTLDPAFLRRLRFVVNFPFPDSHCRSQIWQRVFPDQTPLNGLEYQKLAKLNIAGGSIKNIALNAAFIAAKDKEALGMAHVIRAARTEYIKMEKLLNDSEWRGLK